MLRVDDYTAYWKTYSFCRNQPAIKASDDHAINSMNLIDHLALSDCFIKPELSNSISNEIRYSIENSEFLDTVLSLSCNNSNERNSHSYLIDFEENILSLNDKENNTQKELDSLKSKFQSIEDNLSHVLIIEEKNFSRVKHRQRALQHKLSRWSQLELKLKKYKTLFNEITQSRKSSTEDQELNSYISSKVAQIESKFEKLLVLIGKIIQCIVNGCKLHNLKHIFRKKSNVIFKILDDVPDKRQRL